MTKQPIKNLQEQGRTVAGQFAKGYVQNPKGRKRGSKNKSTQAALALMEGQLEVITQKLIDAAIDGDIAAAKIILDKLVPPARERALPILNLPSVESIQDLPKVTQLTLEAMVSGCLLPSQAQAIMQMLIIHEKYLTMAEESKTATQVQSRVYLAPSPKPLEVYRRALAGEFEE